MRRASLRSWGVGGPKGVVVRALLRDTESLRGRLRKRIGCDGPQVDDLWQELCVRALVKEEQLHGPPGPWLRRLADNLVREHIRRRRRRRTWCYDALCLPTLADAREQERSAADGAAEIEMARRVREVFARMPESARALLEAVYWDGLTYDELSRNLGISVRAVEGRLYRARRVLRQRLGQIYRYERDGTHSRIC